MRQRIIYGTAWKEGRTEPLVALAIDLGFRAIDTAGQPKHYDEAGVGRGLSAAVDAGRVRREDVFLQTKFTPYPGHDPARVPYDPAAPLGQQVAQSFATSLRNLDTEYVDSFILHSPMPSAEALDEVWRAMEAIADAERTRQLGISNCYDLAYLDALYERARIKPAVVQNRFYAATGYDVGIRRFCADRGVEYQSFWTLTANPELLASDAVERAAARHGRTPAQVLFRYLTQEGVSPLTGTQSENHMREDLEIFEFELNEEERGAISARLEAR